MTKHQHIFGQLYKHISVSAGKKDFKMKHGNHTFGPLKHCLQHGSDLSGSAVETW